MKSRAAAAAVVLIVAAGWWASREAPPPPPGAGGPTGEIRGFSLVEYDTAGAEVWTLTADRATEEEGEVTVETIRLAIAGAETPTVLVAPRARLDRASRDIALEGGVEIDLADGGRVVSDRVEWRAGPRRIVAPAPVRFTHAGSWAEAETVVVDPGTRLLKSTNARGLVNLEGAKD